MLIFYNELNLEEGFEVLAKPKHERLVKGRQVSACSGLALFQKYQGKPIRCWSCGCVADRWIADRGQNNHQGYPVLNLYGVRNGEIVLMNRDHIIPKSLGGLDDLENLRPACEVCNGSRGNALTPDELQFRKDNPHLVSQTRLNQGKHNARRAINAHPNDPVEQKRIASAFELIGEPLYTPN